MIIDARQVPADTVVEMDVCIVGSGAAGTTIARELIGTPLRVGLLESGGFDYDVDAQALYQGFNAGRHYYDLDICRLRYFGGTTNHWSGWCRPFEPIDFERRAWVPHSGWPFGLDELQPFYERAHEICQLNATDFTASFLRDRQPQSRLLESQEVVALAYRFSPPTRFGEVYRTEIEAARNVNAYLHANLVAIATDDRPQQVSGLEVATLDGKRFRIKARYVILAAGGIENARLLLASDDVHENGIGNDHDLVGRFFMEHPEPLSGAFLHSNRSADESDPFLAYILNEQGNETSYPLLTVSEAVQEREQILNCGITFSPQRMTSEGWAALRRLVRPGPGEAANRDFMSDVGDVLSDLGGVVDNAAYKLGLDTSPPTVLSVESMGQQAPDPESRITLSEERDALGMRRPILDWHLDALSKRSIRRTQEIIGQELARLGFGRMKIDLSKDFDEWPQQFTYGNHHMGTTRMSSDARTGVVNADCRVHGIENLYIAGSSIFPTGGSAPPTMTIVALATRLADHIKGVAART